MTLDPDTRMLVERAMRERGLTFSDARVAALAIEHGADVISFDRDFARFDGVRHRLPG